MSGKGPKKPTKRQAEAARKKAEREAEFRLKCSIIDEVKEYPVLYDKAHPNHFKCDHKEEVYERIGTALDIEGNEIYYITMS
ncbi:MAG: MADF domain-containing protein [Proteobacteria bacterium]|nr:MADF domain-containing protein [Pseudomonadota bacterium]